MTYIECIKLDKTSLSMNVGENRTLTATVCPTDATNKTLAWSSDNYDIATVDDYGNVCAVAPGMTYINACSTDGNGAVDRCLISVTGTIHVQSVTVSPDSKIMNVGTIALLKATVLPENATYKCVYWSSSNSNIAYVDEETGLVRAISGGQVAITATSDDGHCVGVCVITVIQNPVLADTVTLNRTSLQLHETERFTLKATICPDNATDKTVEWHCDNPDVVTVTENGVVIAKSAGEATVTATTKDGSDICDCCKITVYPKKYVECIEVEPSYKKLAIGQTVQLSKYICPADATNKRITWRTDDRSIAFVNPNSGFVLAQNVGTTKVYATTQDGSDKEASCTIEVVENIPVISVNIGAVEKTLLVGEELNLSIFISPEGASNKNVTWSSQYSYVADVDKNGKVTAKSPGTTEIKVKTEDGNHTDSVIVQVVLDYVTVMPDTDGGATKVVFKNSGKVWYCINHDMIYNEENMNDQVLFNRSEMNFFVDPLSDTTVIKEFTDPEIKLLYGIDPYGVATYIQRRAEGEHHGDNSIAGILKYKDDKFRLLFNKEPLYFRRDLNGNLTPLENICGYDIDDIVSESESYFGIHPDPDSGCLRAFIKIVDIACAVIDVTFKMHKYGEIIDQITDYGGLLIKAGVLYANEEYQEAFNQLIEFAKDKVFQPKDELLEAVFDMISICKNIVELIDCFNTKPIYYQSMIDYTLTKTDFDVNLQLLDGNHYNLGDINKAI